MQSAHKVSVGDNDMQSSLLPHSTQAAVDRADGKGDEDGKKDDREGRDEIAIGAGSDTREM